MYIMPDKTWDNLPDKKKKRLEKFMGRDLFTPAQRGKWPPDQTTGGGGGRPLNYSRSSATAQADPGGPPCPSTS